MPVTVAELAALIGVRLGYQTFDRHMGMFNDLVGLKALYSQQRAGDSVQRAASLPAGRDRCEAAHPVRRARPVLRRTRC